MKLKDIKKKISGVGVAIFLAILALVIVTIDQKNDINVLQAELESAEVGISSVEAEYLDTITLLENTVQKYETSLQDTNNELAVFKAEMATAESVATQLADQLVEANATITDLKENPNCPVQ